SIWAMIQKLRIFFIIGCKFNDFFPHFPHLDIITYVMPLRFPSIFSSASNLFAALLPRRSDGAEKIMQILLKNIW
ncbi:MAG: hypothetical protein K2I38_00945, partial [Duncaniella sp.]|nr:hypothetical protein [Duncaniella sp.]